MGVMGNSITERIPLLVRHELSGPYRVQYPGYLIKVASPLATNTLEILLLALQRAKFCQQLLGYRGTWEAKLG